jgi:hypothetical protein
MPYKCLAHGILFLVTTMVFEYKAYSQGYFVYAKEWLDISNIIFKVIF